MSGREQNNYKFTPHGHNINSVAETFVAVIYNQLRNCDLLVLKNSQRRKSRKVKKNSFADCRTKGLIMKAN